MGRFSSFAPSSLLCAAREKGQYDCLSCSIRLIWNTFPIPTWSLDNICDETMSDFYRPQCEWEAKIHQTVGVFKRKMEDHGYKKFVFPNQENKQVIYSFW